MSFHSDPKIEVESYECPYCEHGNVTKHEDNNWRCDNCGAEFGGSN